MLDIPRTITDYIKHFININNDNIDLELGYQRFFPIKEIIIQ
jgi:hypothetical protein